MGRTECCDVRLVQARVIEVGQALAPMPGEQVVDAHNCLLLPGLHDHHLHLMAMAAAQRSLRLGPGHIETADAFAEALSALQQTNPGDWIRVTGYDPSIVGELDIATLDKLSPERPVRVQHRGGRLWLLNSRALDVLCAEPHDSFPEGVSRSELRSTGRLIDSDQWLSQTLRHQMPDLTDISFHLASLGVTSVTDTTPGNGQSEWAHFAESRRIGALLQQVRVMGSEELEQCAPVEGLIIGELKLHLLESALPAFETLCERIAGAHRRGRNVAVHCVTRIELIYALAALKEAGARKGDRIEHASVCPPELLEEIKHLDLRVVTQPAFLLERGDRYLKEVELEDQAWLYRCRAFREAGIALAIGSDAPFATGNPWQHMHAAVQRRTLGGQVMNAAERIDPEYALSLYLSPADTPGSNSRSIDPGVNADLCLLDRSWPLARLDLSQVKTRATWISGKQVYYQSDDNSLS